MLEQGAERSDKHQVRAWASQGFSPRTTPRAIEAQPQEGEVPPTNRHGLQDPGERQGDKGKAARGTRLRREVNEGLQRLLHKRGH